MTAWRHTVVLIAITLCFSAEAFADQQFVRPLRTGWKVSLELVSSNSAVYEAFGVELIGAANVGLGVSSEAGGLKTLGPFSSDYDLVFTSTCVNTRNQRHRGDIRLTSETAPNTAGVENELVFNVDDGCNGGDGDYDDIVVRARIFQ